MQRTETRRTTFLGNSPLGGRGGLRATFFITLGLALAVAISMHPPRWAKVVRSTMVATLAKLVMLAEIQAVAKIVEASCG